MKTSIPIRALGALLLLTLPFGAFAHRHDDDASPSSTTACDMHGHDMSTMSAAEHQKMMADCERANAAPRKACDMHGHDMSTMSAAEHAQRMKDCAAAPPPASQPLGGA